MRKIDLSAGRLYDLVTRHLACTEGVGRYHRVVLEDTGGFVARIYEPGERPPFPGKAAPKLGDGRREGDAGKPRPEEEGA